MSGILQMMSLASQGAPFPVVASTATGSGNSASWSPASVPSGITAGDGLLFIVANDGNQISANSGGDNGWVHIGQLNEPGNTYNLNVFWKIATATNTITINQQGTNYAYIYYRLTGVGGATATMLSSSGKDMPACTPQEGSMNWLWFSAWGLNGSQTITSQPSGYSSPTNQTNTNVSVSACYRSAAAASEDPGVYTNSGGAGTDLLATIAIAPAQTVRDSNFASVLLLLPLEGANAGTTITDVSSSPKTCTPNGTGAYTNSNGMWGTTSWSTNSSSYFTAAMGASANFSGRFTMEWWAYNQGSGAVAVNSESNTNIYWYNDSFEANGGSIAAPQANSAAAWNHWAIDRDGSNVIRLYRQGLVVASATRSGAQDFQTTGFARFAPNNNLKPTCKWNQIRVNAGVTRYGGAFTPPALRFGTSA